ncbi:hypothetical protein VKT23_019829 [Stygiomarasmius scandens]|uniref:RBR-type E3 ubiquitin transferase n=1 Tax=Marasmiellus scandens TaxID=2682957 RepID=A0ABR1IPR7_9AGAR
MYLQEQSWEKEKQQGISEQISYSPLECIVCASTVSRLTSFTAPCGHSYCLPCLEDFVKISIKDESSFPPKCCRQPFPLEPSQPHSNRWSSSVSFWLLDWDLVHRLHVKSHEFSVPPKDRLYCPGPRCSIFLGSLRIIQAFNPERTTCRLCGTSVCLQCKQNAHPGEKCPPSPEEIAEAEVRRLAKEKKWQTCPGCKQMVERTQGCSHMVCRCGTNFCYGCGSDMRKGAGCICRPPVEEPVAVATRLVPRPRGRPIPIAPPLRYAQTLSPTAPARQQQIATSTPFPAPSPPRRTRNRRSAPYITEQFTPVGSSISVPGPHRTRGHREQRMWITQNPGQPPVLGPLLVPAQVPERERTPAWRDSQWTL